MGGCISKPDVREGALIIDSVFISSMRNCDMIQVPRSANQEESSVITIDKKSGVIHITRGKIRGHMIHDKMITEKNHSQVHRESFSL
jgi:hypothetical protein